MQLTDKPQRHPEATYQTVEEEAIIINLNTGTYYSLNDTGTMFWELLNGQRSITACAEVIAAEYDVEVDLVEADLLELAQNFKKEELIVI